VEGRHTGSPWRLHQAVLTGILHAKAVCPARTMGSLLMRRSGSARAKSWPLGDRLESPPSSPRVLYSLQHEGWGSGVGGMARVNVSLKG